MTKPTDLEAGVEAGTPRTDAAATVDDETVAGVDGMSHFVTAAFARTLERELSALRAELEQERTRADWEHQRAENNLRDVHELAAIAETANLRAESVELSRDAAVAEAIERAAKVLEPYIESYSRMEGRVSPYNVAYDLEHNVIPAIRSLTPSSILAAVEGQRSGIYIASRVKHAEHWQRLRGTGIPFISSWIDESGEGETEDFGELWARIEREIAGAKALIFYASPDDFPFKGALVEIGMALAHRTPVFVVLDGVELEGRTMRPVGSWILDRRVTLCKTVLKAVAAIDAAMSQEQKK